MKFPKSIKVGPHTYQVRLEHPIIDHDGVAHNKWGYCAFSKHYVSINKNLPPDLQLTTFIHEAIHAVSDVYEVSLKERDVAAPANGLTGFLLDNKLLKGDE